MLEEIERRGEDAVREYSRRLDDWDPDTFRVSEEEIERAAWELPDELKERIAFAQGQIRGFAERQRETLSELDVEVQPGVTLGHRHIPVGAVGCYVPGGRYPMLASAFMTVLVAKVAGVPRVVACAPPREGHGIHPAMLHAMATSGADEIICLGGVQGLAAMAFGLGEELAPVDMIVGAGNAYVADAKRQLFGRVGIDLLAGPTEILVIADETSDPELVAADLLGQAEHGPTSPAWLISTSRPLAEAVLGEIERLLDSLPTAEVAGQAWRDLGTVTVVGSHEEAAELANEMAAEHVEVHVDPELLDSYLERLTTYGSLFLGRETTVAYGDKAIGTNHVLPTNRAARYTGGLWVGKFLRTTTYQRMSPEATARVAPAVEAICEAEFFKGHALTARMRLERWGADGDPPHGGSG
jgi:sulfopropanediol 3-dehydrogenase